MLDSPRFSPTQRMDRRHYRNALLRCLPEDELLQITPHLEEIVLKRRGIVQFSNASMHHVYFVEEGLISVLADTGNGKSVETRMIGPEGFVGVRVVLGKRESCHRRIVQVAGSAFRIEADDFADLLDKSKILHQVMLEYVHTVVLQASQLSACNAHHGIQQRMARWLLMAQDRCGTNTLSITHKMLSRLLGVRRATVSSSIAALEQQGALDRSRSLIGIADREQLELAACKCYGLISAPDKELRALGEIKR